VLTLLGTGFGFTEGPAIDHFGNVFFTDQPNDRIHRWDRETGEITLFLDDTGRSNGMFFDQNGYLITAADMHGELWSIAPDGSHTVIVDNYEGNLLNGPNDLWIAPNGGIYFTDPLFVRDYWDLADPRRGGSQQGGEFIYYLSPDRETLTRIGEIEGGWPNGVIGTPDGKILYVAQMIPVGRIFAYDINPDGSLSNRRALADRPNPDGMTIDQMGNVYVAGGRGRGFPSGVIVFNPGGTRILDIPTGQGWTANVTFGGPNRKTLFITAGNSVFGLEMLVRGMK
jgi:gluconolactonase